MTGRDYYDFSANLCSLCKCWNIDTDIVESFLNGLPHYRSKKAVQIALIALSKRPHEECIEIFDNYNITDLGGNDFVCEVDQWDKWDETNEGMDQVLEQAGYRAYQCECELSDIKKYLVLFGARCGRNNELEYAITTCEQKGIRLITFPYKH